MMDQLLVCTRPVLRSETSSMFVLLQACGATVCARVELSVDIFTFKKKMKRKIIKRKIEKTLKINKFNKLKIKIN